ncbi:MAG: hypothetical protein IKC64_05760 [Clostridia bacterium]|nr:hypothetical protein [Clostridia bacterium]
MSREILFSLFILGFYPFILLFKGIKWALTRKIPRKKQIVVDKVEQNNTTSEYLIPIRPKQRVFLDRESIDYNAKKIVKSASFIFGQPTEKTKR